MRIAAVALLVVWCGLTATRLPVWRSPLSLWRHAVTVAPHSPRAALNFGAALLNAGFDDEAVTWFLRAGELNQTTAGPYRDQIDAVIRHRFRWMTAFGHSICLDPRARPWCS